MSLTGVIILLLIALILIFLEVFVLPGINVAGIAGLILLIADIYLAYSNVGTPQAHIVLAIAIGLSAIMLIFGLRANTWRRVSLNAAIDSKVQNFSPEAIKIGDSGIALTRLGPIGKVLINGVEAEAKATNIINAQTKIEVVDIVDNELIVKSLNN